MKHFDVGSESPNENSLKFLSNDAVAFYSEIFFAKFVQKFALSSEEKDTFVCQLVLRRLRLISAT